MPKQRAESPVALEKVEETIPSVEQEAPADGIEKEGIEAPADGAETTLEGDGTGAPLPPIIFTPDAAVTAAVAAASAAFTVRALQSFGDIHGRSYKPGDVVPWDRERAERYAARGLVEIVEE